MHSMASARDGGVPGGHGWRATRTVLTVLFFLLLAGLLVGFGASMDWDEVGAALRNYRPGAIAVSLLICAAGYLACSCYDLLGRQVVGHRLPKRRVMAINFTSYAFTISLGGLVGNMGLRYRLYTRRGLGVADTTKVIVLAMLTNWSGYILLLGGVLVLLPSAMPVPWGGAEILLQLAGGVALALVAAYAWLCRRHHDRVLRWRRYSLSVPTPRVCALQLALSSLSWGVIAANIHWLMPTELGYVPVLAAVLASGLAGALLHIPAGLGVFEAVFIAVVPDLPPSAILAALIVHRVTYQLVPLAAAGAMFVLMEATARRQRRPATGSRSMPARRQTHHG